MSAEDLLRMVVNRLSRLGLNDDVMLYHMDGEWRAEAVNESRAVMLGEASGLYQTDWCASPAEALNKLLLRLPE